MRKSQKAFTLLELLIVIAIIGVLVAALLPTLTGAPAKARDGARKNNVAAIAAAVEAYNAAKAAYPGELPSGCVEGTVASELNPYVAGGSIPVNPSGQCVTAPPSGAYFYRLTGGKYAVAAQLEGTATGQGICQVTPAVPPTLVNLTTGCGATGDKFFYVMKN